MKLDIQLFADGKVVIETDLDSGGFSKGLDKIKSVAEKGFKAVATSVGVVTTAMAGMLGHGVKFNSEIEQLQTSFEVMTGSAEKATEIVQKLKDVGAKTPYELKGLAKTTQILMQYGLTADEAYEATLNFGDIAQGSAEKMQGIALAYGQMSSAGRVNMQDIKQMINQGFNPLQAIAEMTGETMQEVTARYEDNAISVEEVTKAMKFASSEGGKFYQSMEKQSQTLSGQVSTLKDNFDSLTGTLSEGLSQTISGEVLPSINDLLQGMEKAFNENGIAGLAQAVGDGIANMLTAIVEEAPKFVDVALEIINNLVLGIKNNLPIVVQSTISIVKQIITTILDMLPEILEMGIILLVELISGISETIPQLVPTIIEVITKIIEVILANLDKIIMAGIDILVAVIEGIIEAIPQLIDMLPRVINSIVVALTSPAMIMKLITAGIEILLAVIKGIIQTVPQLLLLPAKIILDLIGKFKEKFEEIKDVGKQLITGLWNGIKEKWENLKQKVADLGNGIVSKFKSVFGIASPSKVFRDEIGRYLSQGIGVGFEDELGSVYNDMQKAIDYETGKLSANVESSGTYQMALAGTPTFNLLDNTNNSTQLVVNGKILAEVVNEENRYREVATQ